MSETTIEELRAAMGRAAERGETDQEHEATERGMTNGPDRVRPFDQDGKPLGDTQPVCHGWKK